MLRDTKAPIGSRYLDILILLTLPVFYLLLHIFNKNFSLMFDDNLLSFASYYNVVRSISEGHFPLRGPYLYVDLIRVGVSSILYLPRAISQLLAAAFLADDVERLRIFWLGMHFLYVCLPSISMYILLRYLKFLRWSSVFGAIIYGWNLYMTIMAGVYTAHQRSVHYITIPLVWLIAAYSLDSKRYYLNLASGLLIGWSFLAGGLQPAIYITPFLLIYLFVKLLLGEGLSARSVFRSFWVPFLIIASIILCVLPLLLATPEILPFLKRAHKTVVDIHSVITPGIFYRGLIEPFSQWRSQIKYPWEYGSYLGLITIVVFLTGLFACLKHIFKKNNSQQRWFLAMFMISISVCVGYSYFPQWLLKFLLFQKGFTRYPFRLYPLAVFAIAYFSSAGLDYIQSDYRKGGRLRGFSVLGAALIIGIFSFALKIYYHDPVFGGSVFFSISSFIACLSLLVFIFLSFKPRFIWLLVPLIIADLGLAGYVYCANRFDIYKISTIKRDLYETSFLRLQDKPWISKLPKREIPYRVFIFPIRESGITAQTGYMYNKLRHPFGYSGSLGIDSLERFRDIRDIDHPIFDLLGVSFFCVHDNRSLDSNRIYQNKDALPLIYAADEVRFFDTRSELLDNIYEGNDDVKDTVYFSREFLGEDTRVIKEALASDADQDIEPEAELSNIIYRSSMISFDIKCYENILVVLSEPWLPPWRATIDAEEVKIYRTYGLIQSVLVPEGSHSIRFEYTFPLHLIYISLITQAVIIFIVVTYYLRTRR